MKHILFSTLLLISFACCRKAPEKKPTIQFFLYNNYMNDSILHVDSVHHHNFEDSLIGIAFFELHQNWHSVRMYTNDFYAPMDGNHLLYELDSLGVIYGKSLTWKSYSRLKTNNDSINEIIDAALENIILNPKLQYRSSDHQKEIEFTVPTVED